MANALMNYGSGKTHLRSFAASFWLPNFCHPFSIAAEKVLSLDPARCLASFQRLMMRRQSFCRPINGLSAA
jgi:hypothetical protein